MKSIAVGLAFAFLCVSGRAQAQPLPIDHLTPPLATVAERHAADIASWVSVGAAVGLDAHVTWKTHCQSTWDECEGALVRSGLRVGVTYGAVFLIKALVHRQRPCGVDCGIDSEYASFYSAHTALAFSTLGGARLAISLPLAIGTGGLRVAAGKHYLTDVLTGAAIGALTSRIR
jgi:membrane-associated phospholipid phosphatase